MSRPKATTDVSDSPQVERAPRTRILSGFHCANCQIALDGYNASMHVAVIKTTGGAILGIGTCEPCRKEITDLRFFALLTADLRTTEVPA